MHIHLQYNLNKCPVLTYDIIPYYNALLFISIAIQYVKLTLRLTKTGLKHFIEERASGHLNGNEAIADKIPLNEPQMTIFSCFRSVEHLCSSHKLA